jgi:hypothetical protein
MNYTPKDYTKLLDGIKNGNPVTLSGEPPKRSASIAPGEPYGVSVEKADLMGRIEWAFMGGARDITARKSIEWGDVQKDKDGNIQELPDKKRGFDHLMDAMRYAVYTWTLKQRGRGRTIAPHIVGEGQGRWSGLH